MFEFLVRELAAELRRNDGFPAGALRIEGTNPIEYLWRFSSDTWVRFYVEDLKLGILRGKYRTVVITEITPHPPVNRP